MDRSRILKSLVDGLSGAELHALGMEAMRSWRATIKESPHDREELELESPTPYTFSVHGDFAKKLLPLLPQRSRVVKIDLSDDLLKEPFVDDTMNQEWMSGVLEFLWWLERAGLAVTLQNQPIGYPIRMRLTRRGIDFFAETDDHPLLPGFLGRIKKRCPTLSDGVIEMLVDARACLDVALLRPAVMSLGIAYELAIGDVVEELVTKGLIDKKASNEEAGLRLKRIREMLGVRIKELFPDRDDQRRVTAAYDFADTLRLSRNKSAHTESPYYWSETEEFFVSSGRHLPAIWLLGTVSL